MDFLEQNHWFNMIKQDWDDVIKLYNPNKVYLDSMSRFSEILLSSTNKPKKKKEKFVIDPANPYIVSDSNVKNYFTLYEATISIVNAMNKVFNSVEMISGLTFDVKPFYDIEDKYPIGISKVIKHIKFTSYKKDYDKEFKEIHMLVNHFWKVTLYIDKFVSPYTMKRNRFKLHTTITVLAELSIKYGILPEIDCGFIDEIDSTDMLSYSVFGGPKTDWFHECIYKRFEETLLIEPKRFRIRRLMVDLLCEIETLNKSSDSCVAYNSRQNLVEAKIRLLNLIGKMDKQFEEGDLSL